MRKLKIIEHISLDGVIQVSAEDGAAHLSNAPPTTVTRPASPCPLPAVPVFT
jgi:hypothetical protein